LIVPSFVPISQDFDGRYPERSHRPKGYHADQDRTIQAADGGDHADSACPEEG